MTKEQIKAMNAGDELNVAIFKDFLKYTYLFTSFVPKYSKSISAAWEIISKLQKDNWNINLYFNTDQIIYPFEIRLFQGDDKRVIAHGRTAPEAICKAALLAVMEVKQ